MILRKFLKFFLLKRYAPIWEAVFIPWFNKMKGSQNSNGSIGFLWSSGGEKRFFNSLIIWSLRHFCWTKLKIRKSWEETIKNLSFWTKRILWMSQSSILYPENLFRDESSKKEIDIRRKNSFHGDCFVQLRTFHFKFLPEKYSENIVFYVLNCRENGMIKFV